MDYFWDHGHFNSSSTDKSFLSSPSIINCFSKGWSSSSLLCSDVDGPNLVPCHAQKIAFYHSWFLPLSLILSLSSVCVPRTLGVLRWPVEG